MLDVKALDAYYKTLTDQQLLKLRAEGGFTEEAERRLDKELSRRSLTSDEAKRDYAPEWLDKADVGTVGVLVLEDGERITAEVVGLNEEGDQLSVKVVSPDSPVRNGRRNHRAIPLHRILSFEPQPHLMERWPFSDPCRGRTFSFPRFALMTTIFLCSIAGSIPLFLLLVDRPYGLQVASIITYTLSEVFFTFARTGGGASGPDLPPFKFTCPAVKPEIPRLLWRHIGFLATLFAIQTTMLEARSHLPDWWNMQDRRGSTPFELALLLLCFGLGWVQVRSNRSLLDRAHREFSA
jgi:hypothetical protein